LTHWGFDGATRWTPRALVALPLGGTRSMALGYAEYSQLPSFLYLLAFPENHVMVPIRAQHLTVDVKDLVRTRRFSLGLGAYEKRYTNYPVAADYPQLSMANIADTFGESFLMFPMVSQGRGRTAGVELSLGWQPADRLRMQGSVTYARAWYSGLDGVMRRGNFDIPLAANVAAMWTMHRGLMLSMRYEGNSGRVYTPDDMSQSLAQNRDVYDLTMINRDRSAPYGRLDFRFQQTHPLRGGMLTWHIGLLNALNQKNFYALLWQPNEPKGYQGQQQQNQMPRFPDGGVNYVF
jgi:TonB dependent receptor